MTAKYRALNKVFTINICIFIIEINMVPQKEPDKEYERGVREEGQESLPLG